MRIIIDMPDMPEATKTIALEWVKELIESSEIKNHVKAVYVEAVTWNMDVPKCDCGGKVILVSEKYRCDCGKVFIKI
jgi:hypothetical protein